MAVMSRSFHPLFLDVKPGMTGIIKHDCLTGDIQDKDWWMGHVIHCIGGARKPEDHNLFQIAAVGSGETRWVHADLVTQVLG